MSGCPEKLGLCCPQCPWYAQTTSYGTEWIKCEKRKENNND